MAKTDHKDDDETDGKRRTASSGARQQSIDNATPAQARATSGAPHGAGSGG
jgi:hypothetical protein